MTQSNIKKYTGGLGNLLFVVTEDWYFCSHRLQLAVAAQKAGYNVSVATQETTYGDEIRQAGLRLIPIKFKRSGRTPLSDLITIISLIKIYKNEQPDIIHHVSLKPVLYGSIAARFAGIENIINAMTGLGYVFSSEDLFARFIRFSISPILRYIFSANKTIIIFQNQDDLKTLENRNLIKYGQAVIIRGSGVDPDIYVPGEGSSDIPQVVLIARMLLDKGVGEFVKAAKLLLSKGVLANFILIGEIDNENPTAISNQQLKIWQDDKSIEWWGRRNDVVEILQQSTIACLPSYREGLPKFLLEAASCGLPIVTTDVPGCREIVKNDVNGFLVPARDAEALATALHKLIEDTEKCKKMGAEGRIMVEQEFSSNIVNEKTIALYESILTMT